jgi:hypothetical protein
MSRKTESEELFEQFCTDQRLDWKRAQVKRELEALRKEHEFLKKFDRSRAQLKARGSRSSGGSGSEGSSK